MYCVYICTHDQKELDIFRTGSPSKAFEHFAKLVNSTEYDGQKLGVAFMKGNKQIAFHRYDCAPGQQHNWRGKLEELDVPGPGGRPKTIGSVRKNISIAPELWKLAQKIGGGNASAGISAAQDAYPVPADDEVAHKS
ncbi:hypothetical protein [Escherichia coli]|uniref:hypothetical protein n=1 Tax=Escherichia coli TaxID=562 RepID=UPI0002A41BE2|nr:hypothetical protein [Escherichia coli]EFM2099357.1 hypothetical protein [Escherichia coli]EFM2137074.1 hypothetical protein [Escherichia coli]EKQ3748055.1 hypothetical protein [Escherichia coli]EKQ3862682.1 hypothetical protein [Escherichia coli]ELE40958.1 hypothetical protein A1U5_03584 [Escherichia coli KTE66]